VIPSFYCGGVTLREVQLEHPMATVEPVSDSRVSVEADRPLTALRRARGKAAKSLKLIASSIEILAEIQPASVRD
jgi:hypothetical protein